MLEPSFLIAAFGAGALIFSFAEYTIKRRKRDAVAN
jgi:hypothetical protein